MILSSDVARVAGETGFRPDVVEKVLRLCGILERLGSHEITRGAWLLKGGSALNLLHLDVPRLSVDIDLNFTGAVAVEDMQRMRPEFERALAACCEREGCSVRRAPLEHAGGKFRLRFASVLGGMQNLEVDVNYVARVPLWGVLETMVRFPPGSTLRVPALTIEELAAGKFSALVQRSVVRDAFDAARLLDLVPDLLGRQEFRIPFVCSVASSRTDARKLRRPVPLLSTLAVGRDLVPLLRTTATSDAPSPEVLASAINASVEPAIEELLTWSPGERQFLDRLLDSGEIDATLLHDDPAVQERVSMQPMLQWKTRHVRQHRGMTE